MLKLKISNIPFHLLLFSGFWFTQYGLSFAITVVGGLLIFVKFIRKDYQFNVYSIFILVVMSILILISEFFTSMMYNNGSLSLKFLIAALLFVFLPFLFSNTISTEKIKKNYVICMIFISIFSLVAYGLFFINPSIFNIFPQFVNSVGRSSNFLIFTMSSDLSGGGFQRNQGIFWEPGAFQFFLCIAYIFELSNKERNYSKGVLSLFIVTMITTVSTTGIIVATLLVVYTLSRDKGKLNFFKSLLTVVIIFIIISNILPKLGGYWEYALIDKIENVLDYQPGVAGYNSAVQRVDSFYYPLNEFLKSPIWGIGTEGYEFITQKVGHGIATFTPINWMAKYGLIYGVIIYTGIWLFLRKNFQTNFDTFIIFTILLLSTSSQLLNDNIFLLTMCFKGYIFLDSNKEHVSSIIKVENFE